MIYNGKDFSEFGVHVDESKAFGSPEKDYELIEVVGRNGNLSIYNDRFKDIVLSFPCFIRSGFIEKYRNLLAYLNSLNGYQRLETEKEPNHFRKALFTGSVDVQTTPWNQGGFFTINFSALPQRFLKVGENWTTVSSSSSEISGNPVSIDNPSGLTALTGLNVDIEPVQNLNGYDHPWVGGAGKNLCPTFTNGASSGLTLTVANDGVVTVTGTNTNTAFFAVQLTLPAGNYIMNGAPSGGQLTLRSKLGGGAPSSEFSGNFDDYGSGATFAVSAMASVWLNIRLVAGTHNKTYKPMIRLASVTDDTYEPYSNICPITGHTSATVTRTVDGSATDYTIDLNGTRYGGTLNVLTGMLTVDMAVVDMGTANWDTYDTTYQRFGLYISGLKDEATRTQTIPSSCFAVYANGGEVASVPMNSIYNGGGTYKRIYVKTDLWTDVSSFKTAMAGQTLIYPLATPQTVQLTPQQISLLTGTNIISTDMNSMTVTIASPAELENPTLFESKPIIRVWGNGTLNVNDQYITVANSPYAYIDIDCELMDCYYQSNNANQYVSFSTTDYVTLRSGTNYFSYSGFSKVEVTPRWFEV